MNVEVSIPTQYTFFIFLFYSLKRLLRRTHINNYYYYTCIITINMQFFLGTANKNVQEPNEKASIFVLHAERSAVLFHFDVCYFSSLFPPPLLPRLFTTILPAILFKKQKKLFL